MNVVFAICSFKLFFALYCMLSAARNDILTVPPAMSCMIKFDKERICSIVLYITAFLIPYHPPLTNKSFHEKSKYSAVAEKLFEISE